ncbi:hypothetical protein AB0N31_14475 [Streptomyces sp. NPDC051051]|uniref:hypothetical protein n=1 Tax=Streptomyces sp. NPDC051051 TaxID=3155666 RepID=UPI0034365FD4
MQSPTWGRDSGTARHGEFTLVTDIPVCSCGPASPGQRGSNENMNNIPRQYFLKGADLSVRTLEHRAAIGNQLNCRPRETLGWETPAERLHALLTA